MADAKAVYSSSDSGCSKMYSPLDLYRSLSPDRKRTMSVRHFEVDLRKCVKVNVFYAKYIFPCIIQHRKTSIQLRVAFPMSTALLIHLGGSRGRARTKNFCTIHCVNAKSARDYSNIIVSFTTVWKDGQAVCFISPNLSPRIENVRRRFITFYRSWTWAQLFISF